MYSLKFMQLFYTPGENNKTPATPKNPSPKAKSVAKSSAPPAPAASPVAAEVNGGLDDETIRRNREKLFASRTKKSAPKM